MRTAVELPTASKTHFDFAAVQERLEGILNGNISAHVGGPDSRVELSRAGGHPTTRYLLVETSPLVVNGDAVPGHRICVTHTVEEGRILQRLSHWEGNEQHASFATEVPDLFERTLQKLASGKPQQVTPLANASFAD